VLRFACPGFNFAEAPVKKVKTDTIWQPTSKTIGGEVTMYGGSYVVNCSNRMFIKKKRYFCYRDTTQQSFLS